tara:strand:+ start:350 stop:841 length:492 start_codon:yes stop_codon:yes gene_type:complete
MADDGKIIPFPTDKIVNPRTRELDEQRRKMGEKVAKQIQEQQTKKFVETAVDDISMHLLKNFVDLAMKTNQPNFTKDLALLVDVMRGMIYRDFKIKHPAQKLADKMVELRTNKAGTVSAKINYSNVLDESVRNNRPISGDVNKELKDLNETQGFFEPDGNLDD